MMALFFETKKRFYGSIRPAEENYYEVLRVRENSSHAEIREAFMQLSKEYHPDAVGLGDELNSEKTDEFVKIAEAYSILSRPSRKKAYDEELFMRTVANRQARSGSYGIVHDFHCFGRNRPAQAPLRFKYPKIQKLPHKPLRPATSQIAKLPQQCSYCVVYKPMPRILFKMTNIFASAMSISGICGAIFGIVNARCGICHVKTQAQFSRVLFDQKRLKAMEDLLVMARRNFELANNIRKAEEANRKNTIQNRMKMVLSKYFLKN